MTPGLPIAAIAARHHLPPQLVQAIVQVESGGECCAIRYEPDYPYLWDVARRQPYRVRPVDRSLDRAPRDFPAPAGISRHTEWIGQQMSWGPMQVMGAVAREYGLQGFLAELCDPMTGLGYGCRHLANYRDRFVATDGWRGVAAAYNAGSVRKTADERFENQPYVDKVAAAGGFRGLA